MSQHRKRLAGNFISLSLVQGFSFLFPLITFPWLLRMLGVEGFGIYTLIQTGIMYADLLISFGFGLVATQEISRNISNPVRIREIIATVYIIKFFLFLASLLLILICALFIPFLWEHISLAFISCLYLLGNLLFPDWYFQGIQKMRNITIVSFISKLISLALIILLVKGKDDIGYAVFGLSAGNFIAGVIGFFILLNTGTISRAIPPKPVIRNAFKESGYVFTSIILAPLYSSVNLFILQAFTNPLMVGYYAIAEKIFSAIGMLTNIVNRTFYPHLSQLYVESLPRYKKTIRSIVFIFIGGFCLLAVAQFFAAEPVVHLLAGRNKGQDMSYAVEILRIMSVGILFSPFASFFFQLMILQGQKKASIINISIMIIINLVSGSLFAYYYQGRGMAVSLCITVFLIGLMNYLSFHKKLLRQS